ncbi:MAG: 16S rRNA (cytidine(1402)-2'-O)-methyltransferase [Candidatus Nealsonbacteria bacterium]|nr:16S rRNA (cytidine(1402)-2'-O)-methyltransferase [Candidatus Nealsonbacteria bacterium]
MALYIVSTPIGNLQDITLRALDILKSADLILCEDTRETKKLLGHYDIKTPTISYHQHSQFKKIEYIIQLLDEGKNLALVSDAGTPGISDPGNQLIAEIARVSPAQIAQVSPVPGPSALTAAASASGFPMDKFIFMGFPPAKKKRRKFFEEVSLAKYPVIFYESPYRILKTLKELEATYDSSHGPKETLVVACRELTKKFETIYRGAIGQVAKEIVPKGEFVVIVKNK